VAAFDQARQLVVFFEKEGATWTWDGSTWTQREPAAAPSARRFPSIAYDPSTQTVVLFGGVGPNIATDAMNDTWSWDGTTWTQLQPAHVPPVRYGASLAYDATDGDLVLFGGDDPHSRNDLWKWNGTDWRRIRPAVVPPKRSQAVMEADPSTGIITLFGGVQTIKRHVSVLGDTWTWDGQTWTEQGPAVSPLRRAYAGSAFDSKHGLLIVFGGSSDTAPGLLSDTWTWDGTNWTLLDISPHPSARVDSAMAYDEISKEAVLFGGYDGSVLTDTWTLR
jgi:hypothetical protein